MACFFAPARSAAAALVACSAFAAAQPGSDDKLKAALVLNFARYVEWPEQSFAQADSPVVICLIGKGPDGAAFEALESRKLQNRPVKVRSGVTGETAQGCHVVFISGTEERRMAALVRSFGRQPVLTISDAEGFIDRGGAIGIVAGEEKLQFEVNRSALDQAQLKASSQLLKLARSVLHPGG